MAPEVFAKQPYSTAADVWSFGVIVGELATRQEPFAALSFFEALAMVGKGEVDCLVVSPSLLFSSLLLR